MATKTAQAKKSVFWKFGEDEALYGVSGVLLYAALYWVFKVLLPPLPLPPDTPQIFIRPSVVVPLFMGLAYGPLVGGFAGALGHLGGDLLSAAGFHAAGVIGSGLMGFIPGLSIYVIREYKTLRDYLLAEVFVILGSWGGSAFGTIVGEALTSGVRQSIFTAGMSQLISEGLTNTLNGVLLMPALILMWSAFRAKR